MKSDNPTSAKSIHDEHIRSEMERVNSRLRHFRGVAASVMNDAQKLIREIIDACHAPLTDAELIEGEIEPQGPMPVCGWQEFMEKLNLLEHYINYTKKLCEGSVESLSEQQESEVET